MPKILGQKTKQVRQDNITTEWENIDYNHESEQEPRSWHSRANVVTRLGAGWSWIQILAVATDFSLHQYVQAGCSVHPACYSTSTGDSFPGGKAAGA